MRFYSDLRISVNGIGSTFGNWTQIGPSFSVRCFRDADSEPHRIAVCQCSCGLVAIKKITVLHRANTSTCKLCGRPPVHGMHRTPEYEAWGSMIRRCTHPNHRAFKHYGGRGISVCDKWMSSFPKFYSDVGPRPTAKHTLDRIDNNGNYEPGNVQWATRSEQQRNTRVSRYIFFRGANRSVAELSEIAGIPALVKKVLAV